MRLAREFFFVILLPLSLVWAVITFFRRRWYPDYKRYYSRLPILCVGNIHSGGSGKSPLVAAIANHFSEVAILSRGYRGQLESEGGLVDPAHTEGAARFGDEPWMLSQLMSAPIYVGKDRVRSVQGLEREKKFRGVILDDGFQHLRLGRNLDLAVVSVSAKLSEAYCLPWGDLREPLSSLRFAHAVVLTGEDQASERAWRQYLASRCPEVPVFTAKLTVEGIFQGKNPAKPSGVAAAFSGIAGPERFRKSAGEVKWLRAFPDHHSYSDSDLRWILQEKRKVGADYLLTTDKDFFKLIRRFQALGEAVFSMRIGYELSPEFWYFLENRWIAK